MVAGDEVFDRAERLLPKITFLKSAAIEVLVVTHLKPSRRAVW